MKSYRKILATAIVVASGMFATSANAQEIERGNPFVAPPSWAEEQARQDERTRVIFRELEPELKNDIMRRVNEAQATLEIKLRKRIDLVAQSVSAAVNAAQQQQKAQAQASIQGQSDASPAGEEGKKTAIPEGAKLISCVNKEALYRDSNDVLFKVAKDDPESLARCS